MHIPWSVVVGLIAGVLAFHAKLELRRLVGVHGKRPAWRAKRGATPRELVSTRTLA